MAKKPFKSKMFVSQSGNVRIFVAEDHILFECITSCYHKLLVNIRDFKKIQKHYENQTRS